MLKVLSFGGGVQTVALAAMCALDKFERPDFVVYADTGWEPATEEYLKTFIPWLKSRGMRVDIVTAGSIREQVFFGEKKFPKMPLYFTDEFGEKGMLARQCTYDFKISPVQKFIRKKMGYKKGQVIKEKVELWLGISLDEVIRMRDSRERWIVNRWPFIEKKMTRGNILEWLKNNDIPVPPKSACIGCPFHSNSYWQHIKKNRPKDWADAIAADEKIRKPRPEFKGEAFLHATCRPLEIADIEEDQLDMFGNECEGHCGL